MPLMKTVDKKGIKWESRKTSDYISTVLTCILLLGHYVTRHGEII